MSAATEVFIENKWLNLLIFYLFKAACTILSIDETVRNPKSEQDERLKKDVANRGGRPPKALGMGGLRPNMKLK